MNNSNDNSNKAFRFQFKLHPEQLMSSMRIVTDEVLPEPLPSGDYYAEVDSIYQVEELELLIKEWVEDNPWFYVDWPTPHHMILTTKTLPQRKFSLRISEIMENHE